MYQLLLLVTALLSVCRVQAKGVFAHFMVSSLQIHTPADKTKKLTDDSSKTQSTTQRMNGS